MTEPGSHLILGCYTMLAIGIEEGRLDEISLPMRDIKNLRTRAAANLAWTVNNSIYQAHPKPATEHA